MQTARSYVLNGARGFIGPLPVRSAMPSLASALLSALVMMIIDIDADANVDRGMWRDAIMASRRDSVVVIVTLFTASR